VDEFELELLLEFEDEFELELLLEFEDEFELELLLEFEDEFELELLLEFEDEFELELLLEFEDEFELELLLEFEDEFELELELPRLNRRERASCHVVGRADWALPAAASAVTLGIPPGSRFVAVSACAVRAPPTANAATAVVNFMVLVIPDSIFAV
jgi:hypothetical protein